MVRDGGLRQIFRNHLPGFDFCSIETGLTGRGVPDLNFCAGGIEGWIETKQTQTWKVTIRPEQVGWAERRLTNKGRVFLAVRRKHNELYLFHGLSMRDLIDARLDEVPSLGAWPGGPSKWDWKGVSGLLLAPGPFPPP